MTLRPRPARARRASFALLLAGVLAAGCSPATGPESNSSPIGRAVTGSPGQGADVVRVRACEGPPTSLPTSLAAGLPAPPNPSAPGAGGTMDDFWAVLARRVPGGFAGVLYVENRPVLMLVDPSRAAEAKAALAGQVPNFDVAAAEPRAARWDFAQLYDWRRYLYAQGVWAGTTGLTMSDLDEGANRIYFGAADAAARDRLVEWLSARDLPCDLVLVGINPPASAL